MKKHLIKMVMSLSALSLFGLGSSTVSLIKQMSDQIGI